MPLLWGHPWLPAYASSLQILPLFFPSLRVCCRKDLSSSCQHFHFRLALHARLSGVARQSISNFLICPRLRAQKDLFRGPPPGWGGLRFDPVFRLIMALPLAVNPPLGSLHLFPIVHPFMSPLLLAITVLLILGVGLRDLWL